MGSSCSLITTARIPPPISDHWQCNTSATGQFRFRTCAVDTPPFDTVYSTKMSLLRNFVIFWIVVLLTLHYVVCDTENAEEEIDLSRTFQRFPSADIRERPLCCLDKPETTTTTTTRRPSKPTRPSLDNVKEIDLTFPNCGLRSPKLPDDSRGAGARSTASSSRRGVLSRLGKRDVQSHSRVKRLFDVARPIIVGGKNATPNSWPWMVALFKTFVPGGPKRFLCGASLISRQYVVTAAHCFDSDKGNIDPTKFSIVVGSHTTKDGTEYLVEDILIHPA
ncbi:clotting factor B [Trichonephila inaurata madagascariensis]|uniref:Clotting factor B n=1 Tax=Trichonephila inaurata madagascariensis TaxID=2747483 RepID=A0A8X7BY94_9ARAC|nr:clotting factor B [Trichonephila inaurata madagascariensis]